MKLLIILSCNIVTNRYTMYQYIFCQWEKDNFDNLFESNYIKKYVIDINYSIDFAFKDVSVSKNIVSIKSDLEIYTFHIKINVVHMKI